MPTLSQSRRNRTTYSTELVELALKYQGFPSVKHIPACRREGNTSPTQCDFGTNPQTGFDCSGLPFFLLRELQFPALANIRHTREFFNQFGVLVHPALRQPGDLVFFSKDGSYPSHMGIMINPDQYIHAPGKGRKNEVVKIEDLKIELIQKKHDNPLYIINPIGFKRLAIVENTWSKVV